ncbi:hypothetical protein H7271_07815 [Bittarella massiliensis]|uniref:putative glycoside hydrolase n=1 Tax=Bittarella massiliensis (ex Durand et al. 2017) TaxID=1720313 RepID=UPI00163C3D76|nr:putative glycoside hydrolase [Bittarella massiliensis (ex Durand et al. 2017)]MBC2871509.1 hypothetical protein [Bittarella massiliensis (ex Durand et al. 2017)]
MAKRYKIKRYDKIYRSSNRNLIRNIAIWGAVLVVLAFVGFAAYRPLVNFLNGVYTGEKPPTSQPVQDPGQTGEEETPPQEEKAPVYARVSLSDLADEAKIAETAQRLEAAGITRAVLPLKDSEGLVHYNTGVATAQAAGAVAAGGIDLDRVVSIFSEKGIEVAAQLSAFKDPLVSRYDKTAAVLYKNQAGVLWLDNTAKAGGKPWLNPNAQSAQTYLKALCAELGQKGVKEIILADATYPVAAFLKDAGYGLSGGTTAQQALQASLDGIAQSAKESGAELSLYYPASPWMLAEQVNGVDYRALKADRLYVDVGETGVPNGTKVGELTVAAGTSRQEVADAVRAALEGKTATSPLYCTPDGVSVSGQEETVPPLS